MDINLDTILVICVCFLGFLVFIRFVLLRFISTHLNSNNNNTRLIEKQKYNENNVIYNNIKTNYHKFYNELNLQSTEKEGEEKKFIKAKEFEKGKSYDSTEIANVTDVSLLSNEKLVQNLSNYSLSIDVRVKLINEVGERSLKEAVPKLIELLYEPNLDIVTAASETLVKIGDPIAIEPLLEVTKKNEIKLLNELGIRDIVSVNNKSIGIKKKENIYEDSLTGNLNSKDIVIVNKSPFSYREETVFDISILPENYKNNDGTPISRKEIVIRGLKEPDANIRRIAAKLAIGMTDEEIVPLLVDTLKNVNEQESIRYLVAEALGEMRVKEAIDALLEALKDDNVAVRYSAASALGKIGGQKAIKGLLESLKDQNEYVRSQVAFALGKLQDESVISHLIEALNDSSEIVRFSISEALTNFDNNKLFYEIKHIFGDADKNLKISLIKVLAKVKNSESITLLRQILRDPDPDLYHQASLALIDIEAYELIEDLIEATKRLDNEVISWLHKVDEINNELMNQKNNMLNIEFTKSSISKLAEALNNPSPNVRGCAVNALSDFQSAEAVNLLKKALNDPHEYVRSSALLALGKIGDESILTEVRRFIDDESDEVRYALAKMLVNFTNPLAIEYLTKIIDKEKSLDIKCIAQQSLAKIKEKINK